MLNRLRLPGHFRAAPLEYYRNAVQPQILQAVAIARYCVLRGLGNISVQSRPSERREQPEANK